MHSHQKKKDKKTHQEYQAKCEAIDGLHNFIKFQGDYIKDLNALTDFPQYDTDGACQVIEDWCNNKINDPMTFRDQVHTSVITGTKGLENAKPWKYNMTSDAEEFFKLYVSENSN